jgi:glycosyltransferase involved in cell wall biosynthesis
VYALMRQAAFVLNPSEFEGLGLSLAEASALGKRALVSDLAVLREQQAPGATYFRTNDAGDLAARMAELWEATQAGPDRESEAAAQAGQPARQRALGESFLRAAQAAAAGGQ